MPKLFFELKLTDEWGRVHGVIRREISEEAAYIGDRVVEDMRAGVHFDPSATSPLEATVKVLRTRQFRRECRVFVRQMKDRIREKNPPNLDAFKR